MKIVVATTLSIAILLTASAAFAQNTSQGQGDSSQNTQCWDVLTNVARDKHQGAGRAQASGDYTKMQSGSSEEKKVQGPGADPKDPTGVTVGQGNAAQKRSETGTSLRPSGLPNC